MTNKKAENIREIKCNKCKSFLPEEQFYFSGGRPSAYCIPCTYAAEVRKKIAARGVSWAQYEAEKLRRRADIIDREIGSVQPESDSERIKQILRAPRQRSEASQETT